VRFGLFGTGPWATDVHGPVLAGHPAAELVGVWGRSPERAGALAAALGVRAYPDAEALISDVEAVAVALPPDVQAGIARRAARAGRHLLLDKPVALTTDDADALATEVARAGLASVVFFTHRFYPAVDAFLRTHAATAWHAGRAVLHASVFRTGSPFGASPWRRERGGLWDIGPHALSLLLPTLGPVDRVAAMAGPHDTTHVLLRHRAGPVSTMSLTLDAPPAGTGWETVLYGPEGAVPVPGGDLTAVEAFGRAVGALVGQVTDGAPAHPCDVRFGRDVVAILAAADAARATGTVVPVGADDRPGYPVDRSAPAISPE
jgi:predicted dehydrogenase